MVVRVLAWRRVLAGWWCGLMMIVRTVRVGQGSAVVGVCVYGGGVDYADFDVDMAMACLKDGWGSGDGGGAARDRSAVQARGRRHRKAEIEPVPSAPRTKGLDRAYGREVRRCASRAGRALRQIVQVSGTDRC